MSVLRCAACGAPQPLDTPPDAFCCACAAPLRDELWCPWCARSMPAGQFCRKCGCGLVPLATYGAARMLKAAGVDRLSLADRLRAMPAEQIETLRALYDEQRAVVEQRVDEVRRCERHLARGGHAAALEARLVAALPLEDKALDGLRGPLLETLEDIERASPLPDTRNMAAIARYRTEPFDGERLRLLDGMLRGDDDVALEAALGLAHWRTCGPGPMFASRPWFLHLSGAWGALLEREAGPWGHVGRALLADAPDDGAVHDALLSTDVDLALTAAVALRAEAPLAARLDDTDEARRQIACYTLARIGSPLLGPALDEATGDLLELAMRALRPPLAPALVEPVTRALERGTGDVPRLAMEALRQSLDAARVRRVLPVLVRAADVEALEALMRVEPLPEADLVFAEIVRAGLAERIVYGLDRLAPLVSPATIAGLLVESPSRRLLRHAERNLEARLDAPLRDEIVRIVLGTAPLEVRAEAACVLHRLALHDRSAPPLFTVSENDVRRVFGDVATFLAALSRTLRDDAVAGEVIYREWVANLLGYHLVDDRFLAADPRAFAVFLEALAGLLASDCTVLRDATARTLWRLSWHPAAVATARAHVDEGLSGDVTYWLTRSVEEGYGG